MHRYSEALFDMDGTLVNSSEGIKAALDYAFNKLNLPFSSDDYADKFIGPPLFYSFSTYCHLNEEDTQKAINTFREYYTPKGVHQNRLYDGIKQLIINLKQNGIKIMLCTSKPEHSAVNILNQHGLTEYFDYIRGASEDKSRATKDQVMAKLIEDNPNMLAPVMIGDRNHDINAAEKNSIASIGVLWGFGSRKELCDAGATHIANNTAELEKLILSDL